MEQLKTFIELYKGSGPCEREFEYNDLKDDLELLSTEMLFPNFIGNTRTISCLFCLEKMFKINKCVIGVKTPYKIDEPDSKKHLIGAFICDTIFSADYVIDYLQKGVFIDDWSLSSSLFKNFSLETDKDKIFMEAIDLYLGDWRIKNKTKRKDRLMVGQQT